MTSVVGAVEVGARRVAPRFRAACRQVLTRVSQLDVDAGVQELASRLSPPELRTLDALHLASAISLEDDLGAFACYDERLANAAAREVRVLAPT